MIITLAKYNIDDVLPFVFNGRKAYQGGDNIFHVNMNSLRYHTFKKSLSCVCCDLTGTHFLLQFSGSKLAWENKSNISAHFNLFAGDIMLSKDHILPKSKGGKDYIDNLQTMCVKCNCLKGNMNINLDQLKKLRNEPSNRQTI